MCQELLMGVQYVNAEYNTHSTFLIFYFIPHVLCSVLIYKHDKCFLWAG